MFFVSIIAYTGEDRGLSACCPILDGEAQGILAFKPSMRSHKILNIEVKSPQICESSKICLGTIWNRFSSAERRYQCMVSTQRKYPDGKQSSAKCLSLIFQLLNKQVATQLYFYPFRTRYSLIGLFHSKLTPSRSNWQAVNSKCHSQ